MVWSLGGNLIKALSRHDPFPPSPYISEAFLLPHKSKYCILLMENIKDFLLTNGVEVARCVQSMETDDHLILYVLFSKDDETKLCLIVFKAGKEHSMDFRQLRKAALFFSYPILYVLFSKETKFAS